MTNLIKKPIIKFSQVPVLKIYSIIKLNVGKMDPST